MVWCQSSQGLRVILARSLSQLSHHDELTLTAALQHCSMQLHTPINIFDTFLCNPDTRHAGAARHTQRGADGQEGRRRWFLSSDERREGGINQIRESRIEDSRQLSSYEQSCYISYSYSYLDGLRILLCRVSHLPWHPAPWR